jgi:hypothetical protein
MKDCPMHASHLAVVQSHGDQAMGFPRDKTTHHFRILSDGGSAGHVSRRMLERYSHVRMEAKRKAMEALAASTRMAGYDTNHDTNAPAESTLIV